MAAWAVGLWDGYYVYLITGLIFKCRHSSNVKLSSTAGILMDFVVVLVDNNWMPRWFMQMAPIKWMNRNFKSQLSKEVLQFQFLSFKELWRLLAASYFLFKWKWLHKFTAFLAFAFFNKSSNNFNWQTGQFIISTLIYFNQRLHFFCTCILSYFMYFMYHWTRNYPSSFSTNGSITKIAGNTYLIFPFANAENPVYNSLNTWVLREKKTIFSSHCAKLALPDMVWSAAQGR